jgi:hypothetical protein
MEISKVSGRHRNNPGTQKSVFVSLISHYYYYYYYYLISVAPSGAYNNRETLIFTNTYKYPQTQLCLLL